MPAPLIVAAAQPVTVAHGVAINAAVHADTVRAAGSRLVVFPELSLTGYGLDAEPIALNDKSLTPLVEACGARGVLALCAAPVRDEAGRLYIAMLGIDDGGIEVVYRKTWLGGGETARFAPGDGPAVIEVDGWRIGLGICKDTSSPEHIAGTAALGVDAYAAGLVHRLEELSEQESRAVLIAKTCRAWVVFASFAGPTGGGFTESAGSSSIWSPDGLRVTGVGPEIGAIARAAIGGSSPL